MHTEYSVLYSVKDKNKVGVKYYSSTEMDFFMHSVMCVKSRIVKDSEPAALQETLNAVSVGGSA